MKVLNKVPKKGRVGSSSGGIPIPILPRSKPEEITSPCYLVKSSTALDAIDIGIKAIPVDHHDIYSFPDQRAMDDTHLLLKKYKAKLVMKENNWVITFPLRGTGMTGTFTVGRWGGNSFKSYLPQVGCRVNLSKYVIDRAQRSKQIDKHLLADLKKVLPNLGGFGKKNHPSYFLFKNKEFWANILPMQIALLDQLEGLMLPLLKDFLQHHYSDLTWNFTPFINRVEFAQDLVLFGADYTETNFISFVCNKLENRLMLLAAHREFSASLIPKLDYSQSSGAPAEQRRTRFTKDEYELQRKRGYFPSMEAYKTWLASETAHTIYYNASHMNHSNLVTQVCVYPFIKCGAPEDRQVLIRVEPRNKSIIDGKKGESLKKLFDRILPKLSQFHLTDEELESFKPQPSLLEYRLLRLSLKNTGLTEKQILKLEKGSEVDTVKGKLKGLEEIFLIRERSPGAKNIRCQLRAEILLVVLKTKSFQKLSAKRSNDLSLSALDAIDVRIMECLASDSSVSLGKIKQMSPDLNWSVRSDRTLRRKKAELKGLLNEDPVLKKQIASR